MPTETRKKRILLVNEYSMTKSGFGTYGNQIMNRLYDTGKYELAEFASAAKINDSKDKDIRWMFYANSPSKGAANEADFEANPQNNFGKWRFDRVLLDFKPDIVFDIRDFWMMSFEADSPLRRFFHWAIMPTVDSAPQDDDWIDYFINADGVFTYTDWGKKVLEEQGGGKIKLLGTASPGVEMDVFKPVKNRSEHRAMFGFEDNVNIVGSVMRNQKRKLFPDLIKAFAMFLDKCKAEGNHALADNTYLYLHTSYPDSMGWNFPYLLKNSGISNKVMFTYVCTECNNFFPSFFQDARTVCHRCNSSGAILSNVQVGLDRESLAQIYNCFDVYVQYAICEGFGMSQVEATACGVPLMSVDYSAMEDVVRKVKGYPIPYDRMFLEMETQANRVYPSNKALADTLYRHFTLPESVRTKLSKQARKLTEKYYDYDDIAKTWEKYFDSVELKDLQGKWDAPIQLIEPNLNIPSGLTGSELVDWCYVNILKKPEMLNSYERMGFLKSINLTHQVAGGRIIRPQFKKEDLIELFKRRVQIHNNAEEARCGVKPMADTDYIRYAHTKKRLQEEDS